MGVVSFVCIRVKFSMFVCAFSRVCLCEIQYFCVCVFGVCLCEIHFVCVGFLSCVRVCVFV